jgi:glycosyltransferase involved in cell wall biosynthesis
MFSLLIPVFNEEGAVEATIRRAYDALKAMGEPFEILVINDGSTDGTAKVLKNLKNLSHVQVIERPENVGYSAALKLGIRSSTGEVIGITDADGTYPVEKLPDMLKEMKEKKVDMVVGARNTTNIPFIRKPAKAIVNGLANTLVGKRIPDLNSGLRVFTRELAERFMPLYPQRFSFTITITLAAFTNDYTVRYVPIEYGKRIGKSSLSAGFNGLRTFSNFLSLIVRIIVYFRPLKFFAIPALLLLLSGTGFLMDTAIYEHNISDTGLLLFLSGLQIGLFGLLAEVVVRSRPGK